jgi:arylsulfatase A-like enzyme
VAYPWLFFSMIILFLLTTVLGWLTPGQQTAEKPNFIILLVDDQRWDALSFGKKTYYTTPALARAAARGTYFPNAFVTLSICSPSRAAILSGRYGSKNGVMNMTSSMKNESGALGNILKENGYATAVFGKWHLPNKPKNLGFEYSFIFKGITGYWDVNFLENDKKVTTKGFVDETTVGQAISYLRKKNDNPFFLFVNTFAPHMDENYDWPIEESVRSNFNLQKAPLPVDWNTDYTGKPAYLKTSRPHTRALEYGYDKPDSIKSHVYKYAAANLAMDQAVGKLFDYLSDSKLYSNTYVIVLGDNGWFMGEHSLTSKVLAYEESIRVPFFIVGPNVPARTSEEMVMNIDIFPTITDLAGIKNPQQLPGISLRNSLSPKSQPARTYVFYEAPLPVHGTYPHYAIRTRDWKYIITYDEAKPSEVYAEELYNLKKDPSEITNRINDKNLTKVKQELRQVAQQKIRESRQ